MRASSLNPRTNIQATLHVYTSVMDGAIEVAAAGEVAGDTEAPRVGDLFEAHHQRLYRLARRLVSNADEARDMVQDTFLRAARSPLSIPRGMPSEEAWLVRVLINLCRDRWRKRDVEKRFQERHVAEAPSTTAPHSEAALIAQTVIWRALRELAPRRRAVMVLHELDGTSIAEISHLLGIAAVTVRWHLSQGRRQLGRIINPGKHLT